MLAYKACLTRLGTCRAPVRNRGREAAGPLCAGGAQGGFRAGAAGAPAGPGGAGPLRSPAALPAAAAAAAAGALCAARACAAARAGHWTLTCWLAAEAALTPTLLVAALVLLRHVDRFAAAGAGALRGTRVRSAAGPLSTPGASSADTFRGGNRLTTPHDSGASWRQAGAVMDALRALGLGRGAGPAEVRQTYRALAKGCAPARLRCSRARAAVPMRPPWHWCALCSASERTLPTSCAR